MIKKLNVFQVESYVYLIAGRNYYPMFITPVIQNTDFCFGVKRAIHRKKPVSHEDIADCFVEQLKKKNIHAYDMVFNPKTNDVPDEGVIKDKLIFLAQQLFPYE